MKKPVNDPKYTGFRPWKENQRSIEEYKSHNVPYTSDSGPTSSGPIPTPIKKRDIGRMETVRDMPNSFVVPTSAKAAYR